MEEVLDRANELFSRFLGVEAEFKACRTTNHGDIFLPQGGTEIFKNRISEKGLDVKDVLSLDHFKGECFSKAALNPQGQLCVSLNRPQLFTKYINIVISLGDRYGDISPPAGAETGSCKDVTRFTVLNHFTLLKDIRSSGAEPFLGSKVASPHEDGPHIASRDDHTLERGREITVAEGRSLLIVGLLSNVLRASGCLVNCVVNYMRQRVTPKEDDHVWHLLSPFMTSDSDLLTHQISADHFLSYLHPLTSQDGAAGGMMVEARKFLLENSLTGKHGFDKNLDKIQVTDARRELTDVGSVGCKVCGLSQVTREGSHVIIHVAEQRRSYATQQSMVLAEVYSRGHQHTATQHLLLTGGVDVNCARQPVKQCSMNQLIRSRLKQMTQAYVVKYGDRAEGPQLQSLATKMAEAVIKFELLSSDISATVKLDLPDSDHLDANVRFTGAFVLYNYARLASVMSAFRQACGRGVYPSLPAATDVDFSLLTDEEEWQLLFHYVLQYLLVVKETAHIRKKGVGVHVDMCLKRVCLFLNELSHAVSSYYSRVKILLPPEPHLLPLIFARLHLVMAVRQVMNNALRILAIEPLEQL